MTPLQYLASGMPILAPPVGVLKIFADHGKDGVRVSSTDDWLNAVRKLRHDEPLRQTMGSNGIR